MATLIKSGNYWHLQWWDARSKKTVRRTTKLLANEANKATARKIARKLQNELTTKNNALKGFRLREKTIGATFGELLNIYQDSHKKTIKDIKRFKKKFLEYFDENEPVISVNKRNVEDFLLSIKKLNLKQNSKHAYGKRLKHYLNFLFEYDYIPMFKINRKIMTKQEVPPIITFKPEDFRKIFIHLSGKKDWFQTAVFLLAYTGLRSTDIISIKSEDIDLERRIIKYYSPKRKKNKVIGFHRDLVEILHSRMEIVDSGKILPYANEESLGRAVSRYFKQIGINGKSYSSRTFRKNFVTYCRGVLKIDKTLVENMVGHENKSTQDRFYYDVNVEIMKDEISKFSLPLVEWMKSRGVHNED